MNKKRLMSFILAFLMFYSLCFNSFISYSVEIDRKNEFTNQVEHLKDKTQKEEFKETKDIQIEKPKEQRIKSNKKVLGNNLEIGEEIVPQSVGIPEDFDLSTINTIAKDKDGKFYGVKTYGNSFDTTSFKTFYKISEEQFNKVAKDFFMIFKRQDGKEFEIPGAKIGTNSITDPQPSGTTAGKIFTEVQFKHHMAYREGFIVNNKPYSVRGQEDLTWSIELKKDWVIEPCMGYASNGDPDYAYVYYNVEIDGKGHKIYRNDDKLKVILQLGSGLYGNTGIPVKTATLKNLTIDGSGKYYGIEVSQKGILKLENVKIENCHADRNHSYYGGAIKLNKEAQLTMDAATIISNCSANMGGGIRLLGNNNLTINGSKFLNNKADLGGVICSLDKNNTIKVKDATFDGNKATSTIDGKYLQGGAIYSNSALNIQNTEFKNNIANGNGGAIASFADTTIQSCKFNENQCNRYGGAIYSSSEKLDINATSFIKNRNYSQGGAIYANTKLNIEESNFEENISNYGAAIINYEDTTLKNSNFNKNVANTDGGAIYQSSNSKLEIENANFSKNGCNRNGGAVYINRSVEAKIRETNFVENISNNSGGSIFIQANNPKEIEVFKCKFDRNESPFGGGIYLNTNSKLQVKESNFMKNQAGYGAGISTAPNNNSNSSILMIDNSIFDGNYALLGGGVLTTFPTEIKNSTFTKNEAQVHPQDDQTNPHGSGVGGAVYVMYNQTDIDGCKFIENNAFGSGGAVGIMGVIRDKNDPKKITGLKDNVEVNVKGETIFEKNYALVGQGGAIYTIPYSYDLEGQTCPDDVKAKAYENLTTSADTVFKGNWTLLGFFNPPADYGKFTKLQFARNSFTDTLLNRDVSKSLINNYDVNYKNTKVIAYFDPNGGEFKDPNNTNPKSIKEIIEDKDSEIEILEQPKRDGYKFLGWKSERYIPKEELNKIQKEILEKLKDGKIYNPGDKFKLDSNYIFTAQWEEEKKPKPIIRVAEYVSSDENKGIVDVKREILTSILDSFKGSTAKAKEGYVFVNWTNEKGEEVSTNEKFVPETKVYAKYFANFKKIEEPQTPDKPTPEKPENSKEPEEPETQQKPKKPNPEKENNKNPKTIIKEREKTRKPKIVRTSDVLSKGFYLGLMAVSFTGFVAFKRKQK